MKKILRVIACLGIMMWVLGTFDQQVYASEKNTISAGIYLNDISLEGKTIEEAEGMVNEYVEELLQKNITLKMTGDHEVTITPGDIGLYWSNPEILEEAASIGKKGNIVERYKIKKDLQFENRRLSLQFNVDRELVKHVLSDQCAVYNVEARNATLSRENDEFVIYEGQTGMVVDENASLSLICDFFTGGWNGEDTSIDLVVAVDEPLGSKEELSRVKDVLGSFTTSFKTSGSSRSANVRNGCALINGTTLYPGEEFSTYDTVSPFSEANGYYMAGSYLNGQVVDSLGGGICQVSTTLYNAVLLSELQVTERHNHSMIVTYVDPSADAAISESAGKDFKFVNNTSAPIYIEGYTTDDKQIGFVIYGEETRDEGHRVAYESEVVSKTYPDTEVIYTDASAPVGSVTVQSAHVGYKANLWKVVYENGEQVSREMVNSSTYKMAPRSATVGVATADPNAYNEIMAAISTNNIDHVKNVAAALAAAAAPPTAPDPQAAQEQAPPAPAEIPAAEAPAQ
ncbi:MAG: VanW family protein [Suilimivivens sp.]